MTKVVGFTGCRSCGTLVLNEASYATSGRCVECWLAESADERDMVEVLIEGRVAKLTTKNSNRAKNRYKERRRKTNPAYSARHNAVIAARRRAARRLGVLHRKEYLELLAVERAKVGMDPWPAVLAVEYRQLCEAEDTTMSRPATYDPPDGQAQDVDSAEGSRPRTA
jgi:hypothetical protein